VRAVLRAPIVAESRPVAKEILVRPALRICKRGDGSAGQCAAFIIDQAVEAVASVRFVDVHGGELLSHGRRLSDQLNAFPVIPPAGRNFKN